MGLSERDFNFLYLMNGGCCIKVSGPCGETSGVSCLCFEKGDIELPPGREYRFEERDNANWSQR